MNLKKVLSMGVVAAMALSLAACGGADSSSEAASEPASTAPGSSEAVSSEAEGEELSGSVSTNGSTSMENVIGILSEQFMADHPGVTVTYDPTGSGTGIDAAKNGTTDIGLSSRALTEEETAGGLVGTNVALDGIEYDIFDELDVAYVCDCSQERCARALISLGRGEVENIFAECRAENKPEEIQFECHFCDKKYLFSKDEALKLFDK